jgi:hypothetical protein
MVTLLVRGGEEGGGVTRLSFTNLSAEERGKGVSGGGKKPFTLLLSLYCSIGWVKLTNTFALENNNTFSQLNDTLTD